MKNCAVDGCPTKVRSKGFCNRHYQLFLRNGDPLVNKRNRENKGSADTPIISIKGPRPEPGHKAVYFLRDTSTNTPFYVGSTKRPVQRLARHRANFDKDYNDIEMVIVRCCSIDEAVYWESKLIVEMFEAGIQITNINPPHWT